MMGGSGGGGFRSSRSPSQLGREVQRELARAKLDSDVNALLSERLAQINARDVQLINKRLDEIISALGDRIEDVDRLLYGGSVAKHTYVDGLSDVDCLVVLKSEALPEDTPQALIGAMATALRQGLDAGEIAEIVEGFAVTVRYKDGHEVQLLPAVERDGRVAISDKRGTGWSLIRPKAFEERLTAANGKQDGRLVPAIKLAKAVVDASTAESERPGGYHMEALAIDAFRDYDGPRTNKAMLSHFFERASDRIARPISDVTGQSDRIDETLGESGSTARQRISTAFSRIAACMRSATDASAWDELFD